MSPPRIYLDNAATSWPKPDSVYQAVLESMRDLGAPAGRGAYRQASEVERHINQSRKLVADLLHVPNPKQIIFTSNGTDSINLVLHGFLQAGDHVVTTNLEHNSILRPLDFLSRNGGVEVSTVEANADGVVQAEQIERELRSETKLICLVHVSNVTGAIQPIEEVARLARANGVAFLVDAAQSLGHLDLAPQSHGIDFLAAPGHKGLLGPLGTGVLYIRPGIEESLQALKQGGTGTSSDTPVQPEELPEKYESGNLNVPGIIGLGAGLRFLNEKGIGFHREHLKSLTQVLIEGLSRISRVRLLGPSQASLSGGVVSFVVDSFDSREFATLLDSAFSIQVRAGFHCAPLVHKQLGTEAYGGAVRVSPGGFNTIDEINTTVQAIEQLCESVPSM